MKIRTGFVSNSSSSSFLVLLKEVPETTKQLRELIFNKRTSKMGIYVKEYLSNPYYDEDTLNSKLEFKTTEVAEYLGIPKKEDICMVLLQNKKDLIKFIKEGLLSGEPEDKLLTFNKPEYPMRDWHIPYDDKEYTEARLKYHKEEQKWAERQAKYIAEELIREYAGCCLCKFEASDNDGELGSTIEHGETFASTPFWLRFSQH